MISNENEIYNDSYAALEICLHINENHNPELMAACRTLRDYAKFVQKIRENRATMAIKDAVVKAVNECIQEDILRDFLTKHKAEATNMSIYEYDKEQHEKFLIQEGIEKGREDNQTEDDFA